MKYMFIIYNNLAKSLLKKECISLFLLKKE